MLENIYLHFLLFFNTKVPEAVEILPVEGKGCNGYGPANKNKKRNM